MDKAKPTITVITIVKDIVKSGRKDLLRECIESVSGQTYQNIQHILWMASPVMAPSNC